MRSTIESLEKKKHKSEMLIDRLTKETHMLSIKCQDFTNVQKENTRLNVLLKEFKNSKDTIFQLKSNSDAVKKFNLDSYVIIPN